MEQEHNGVIEELLTQLQDLETKQHALDKNKNNFQEQLVVVATKSSPPNNDDDGIWDNDDDDEWQILQVEKKRIQRLEGQLLEQDERHVEEKVNLHARLDAALPLCLQQEQQQQPPQSTPKTYGEVQQQQPVDKLQSEDETSQDQTPPFFQFGGDHLSRTGLHVFALEFATNSLPKFASKIRF